MYVPLSTLASRARARAFFLNPHGTPLTAALPVTDIGDVPWDATVSCFSLSAEDAPGAPVAQQVADGLVDHEPTAAQPYADQQGDGGSREPVSSQGTLPRALAIRIPLKIFGFVIDAMNQPALAAAALVCAAWNPRAMRNLYRTVEIYSRRRFDMLFKQCHTSPRVK
ncbi:uncharacterized protein B0H18DRAFT_1121225 [Fomitopsis serialis]|uniref:uncharacterized protein n=1 Tax=Fomitopsis serialis TaxID=139415 RepID=UPI00200742EF|nr:uncharacterized protein B0H18DRAFT_1121225 [Neoantrodia serialis]KAH9921763.1 hypothetical protein B0H18DRAFT_1121225 [Neoantrodia serialis]